MSSSFSTSSKAGLITISSSHSATETVNRFEAALKEKGIHLFAKIDHGEGAKTVGLSLRPTIVLLFGNPQAGTPLMQSNQTIGIDLPLKALVWEDEKGKVWLTYNDPEYLAERHNITDQADAVKAMSSGLQALAKASAAT
jgi:uncharacterized protein (DUF302 family)